MTVGEEGCGRNAKPVRTGAGVSALRPGDRLGHGAIQCIVEAMHRAVGALETIAGITLARRQGCATSEKPGQREPGENRSFCSHGAMISARWPRAG